MNGPRQPEHIILCFVLHEWSALILHWLTLVWLVYLYWLCQWSMAVLCTSWFLESHLKFVESRHWSRKMRDTPLGFDLLIFTELHDITPGEGLRSCMNLYVFELPCSVRIGEIWTKVQARIISQCKPSSKKELDPAIFPNTVHSSKLKKVLTLWGASNTLLIIPCVAAIHSRYNARPCRLSLSFSRLLKRFNQISSKSNKKYVNKDFYLRTSK